MIIRESAQSLIDEIQKCLAKEPGAQLEICTGTTDGGEHRLRGIARVDLFPGIVRIVVATP